MTEPLPVVTAPGVAKPPTFWGSVLGAKKAIAAGVTWTVAFLAAVLVASGGRFPTWQELLIALAGYIPAHTVTYALHNSGTKTPDGGRVG